MKEIRCSTTKPPRQLQLYMDMCVCVCVCDAVWPPAAYAGSGAVVWQWGVHVPGAGLGPGEELAVRPSAGPASSQPQSGQSRGGHAEVAARGHDQLPVPHAAQLVSGPHIQLSRFMYMIINEPQL